MIKATWFINCVCLITSLALEAGAVVLPSKVFKGEMLPPAQSIFGNPYMGWILEYNAVEGLPYQDCQQLLPGGNAYPEFEVIEILSTWGDIERQEGKWDWSRLDAAIELWESKGKRIRLRISNDDIGPYFSNLVPQDRMGTPEWLYSQYGVQKQKRTYDGASGWWFPNIGHPIYQEKLSLFVNALAYRYKLDPLIEAVSLRGYGAWAEWHDGYVFANTKARVSALRQMIDIWGRAWKGTGKLLSLPVSVDCQGAPWGSPACAHFQSEDYGDFKYQSAYDYALKYPMLTFNKDCVGNCTQPNEYKLMNDAFNQKKLPLIGEFGGFYKDYKYQKDGRSFEAAIADIYKQKLNYITAFGWSCNLHDADLFYQEQNAIINKVHTRIGYRLFLRKMIFPANLTAGAPFVVTHHWDNKAYGRFYGNYIFRLGIYEKGGRLVWQGDDEKVKFSSILSSNSPVVFKSTFQLPASLPEGEYDLKFEVASKGPGNDSIRLAMKGRDFEGRYSIGTVLVVKP